MHAASLSWEAVLFGARSDTAACVRTNGKVMAERRPEDLRCAKSCTGRIA